MHLPSPNGRPSPSPNHAALVTGTSRADPLLWIFYAEISRALFCSPDTEQHRASQTPRACPWKRGRFSISAEESRCCLKSSCHLHNSWSAQVTAGKLFWLSIVTYNLIFKYLVNTIVVLLINCGIL